MNGPFELCNENGTLAGYYYEPTEEERAAVQAWLVDNQQPAAFAGNLIKWNDFINGPKDRHEKSTKDFSLHVRKSGENHPVSVYYRGHNLPGK